MRLILPIIVLSLSAISLSACNTIEGVGRDLTSLGQTMKGE